MVELKNKERELHVLSIWLMYITNGAQKEKDAKLVKST